MKKRKRMPGTESAIIENGKWKSNDGDIGPRLFSVQAPGSPPPTWGDRLIDGSVNRDRIEINEGVCIVPISRRSS